jgi:hypothetical protein
MAVIQVSNSSNGSTVSVTPSAPATFSVASLGSGASVSSVAGRTGAIILAESDVTGLVADLTAAKNRTNHTGSQASSTISDFASATRTEVELELAAGSGIVLTPSGSGASRVISISSSGGGGSANTTLSVAQAAHGFVVGNAVYHNGTTFAKSNASAPATAYCSGIVSAVANTNTFTITTDGIITGLSGLTAGSKYFLSTTAGALSAAAPLGNNTVTKPVLMATSTTDGIVRVERGTVNVVTSTYARMGINFGTTALTATECQKHLQWLRRYIKVLRINIPSWDDATGITNTKATALMAKRMGFETSYGVTAAGTGHDVTYLNGWKSAVDTAAAWAYANGIETFYIGNEEDWWINQGGITGSTELALQTWILAKAVSLKASYPTMRIVYSTAEGEILNWQTSGTAGLDGLGFNCYGNKAHFDGLLPYIKGLFGTKLFISECGPVSPYAQFIVDGGTDTTYRQNWTDIVSSLKTNNLNAYAFDYDWGGSYGTVTDWGFYNGDGTYKPGIEELFGMIA